MKLNNYHEFVLEDMVDLVELYFPDEISPEMSEAWGLPQGFDTSRLQQYFDEFVKLYSNMQEKAFKEFLLERELFHICNEENMEFLQAYMGNTQLSNVAVKRKEFYKKMINRKTNEAKQAANKAQKVTNTNNAQSRKSGSWSNNNSKSNSSYSGNNSSNKSQNSNNSNSNSNSNQNKYGGNNQQSSSKWQGQNNYTPSKCPRCLEKWHGNSQCQVKTG